MIQSFIDPKLEVFGFDEVSLIHTSKVNCKLESKNGDVYI